MCISGSSKGLTIQENNSPKAQDDVEKKDIYVCVKRKKRKIVYEIYLKIFWWV